jgi:hypothetical protein
LQRQGQEQAQRMARGLPPDVRSSLERREGSPDVRARCTSMYELNRAALHERDARLETQSSDFMRRCQQLPTATWECVDRGAEGRADPDCRQHLALLDRELRTVERQGREVERPAQRIDTLAQDRWETERDRVAPDSLTPDGE